MKIDSKGFTVVELVLSFAFVSILSVTLFAAVTNYRDKQIKVAGIRELMEFRDKMIIDVQNDISLKLLKNVEYCPTVYEKENIIDGDNNTITREQRLCVKLNFLDDTSKELKISSLSSPKSEEVGGQVISYIDKKNYFSYGDIRYEIPDEKNIYINGNFMFKSTSLDDDIENNIAIYNITIPIKHKTIDGNFDISITASGKKSITNAPGEFKSYNAGDIVTVQINPTTQMEFYVLKPSNSYSSKITLIAPLNLTISKFYDTSVSNSYDGSLPQNYLKYKFDEWVTADEVRLPYAEEIGFLVGACPKYMINDEETQVNLLNVNKFISTQNGEPNSYWTQTAKKGNDNKVWVVDGIKHIMEARNVTEEYGVRPVVVIDKSYIIGQESGTYRIVFDGNGNNVTGGTTPSITCNVDQNCTLPNNLFVKSQYTFQGWATSRDSTIVQYTNGQTVRNLAKSGVVTLYAVWTRN